MTETGPRVLVVDDERAIRRFLSASLTAHGYIVFEATTGAEAIQAVITDRPDIVILDLGLPDLSGIEVTARLREWATIPILVLSVRESETDKIAALDAGADDYITKPFSVGELLARLRVALRHAAPQSPEAVFTSDDLTVDLAKRIVTVAGHEISLTPTEYDLLRVLMQHAGQVMTHRQLLREVWGPGYADEAHLLRVNISNLRRKLEPEPARQQYIITEPGVGYRLRLGA
jgi:two-component system, OmpR family, KDP operon response regulator KdpE